MIAIITLLHTASALLAEEIASAQKNGMDAVRLTAIRMSLLGVISALTAKSEAEVDSALEKAAEHARNRRK